MIPQMEKQEAPFKLVDYVVIWGKRIKCDHDVIDAILEHFVDIDDECHYIIRTQPQDQMKKWLALLISSNDTLKWLEDGSIIEENH